MKWKIKKVFIIWVLLIGFFLIIRRHETKKDNFERIEPEIRQYLNYGEHINTLNLEPIESSKSNSKFLVELKEHYKFRYNWKLYTLPKNDFPFINSKINIVEDKNSAKLNVIVETKDKKISAPGDIKVLYEFVISKWLIDKKS